MSHWHWQISAPSCNLNEQLLSTVFISSLGAIVHSAYSKSQACYNYLSILACIGAFLFVLPEMGAIEMLTLSPMCAEELQMMQPFAHTRVHTMLVLKYVWMKPWDPTDHIACAGALRHTPLLSCVLCLVVAFWSNPAFSINSLWITARNFSWTSVHFL